VVMSVSLSLSVWDAKRFVRPIAYVTIVWQICN
jgi:hypothetical protein